MRELNSVEVEHVSGAGFFVDIAGAIGGAIGSIVDAGTALGGLKTNATTPAETLGKGIGSILEFNFIDAVSQMGLGIVGIVNFGIDAIGQLTRRSQLPELKDKILIYKASMVVT